MDKSKEVMNAGVCADIIRRAYKGFTNRKITVKYKNYEVCCFDEMKTTENILKLIMHPEAGNEL
jgi:hypothetical protein